MMAGFTVIEISTAAFDQQCDVVVETGQCFTKQTKMIRIIGENHAGVNKIKTSEMVYGV